MDQQFSAQMKKKFLIFNFQFQISKGFTLIELLIVIAVLGILAAVVLVAINPLEQLARGRDAGRKNTVGQLATAVQAYYTSRNAQYPPETPSTWINGLVSSGELKTAPALISYSGGIAKCTPPSPGTDGSEQNGYCYDYDSPPGTNDAIIWVRLESTVENSNCPSGEGRIFAWSSVQNKAGVACWAASGPGPMVHTLPALQ